MNKHIRSCNAVDWVPEEKKNSTDFVSHLREEKLLSGDLGCERIARLEPVAGAYLYCACKVKVKVTLLQALRLCTGRTAHRGSRGIPLHFLYHGTRRGWGVSVTPRPLFTPGKDPVPIVQEAGWAHDRSGQVRKISPPTGIRSPDRPARSQPLYATLRYPPHILHMYSPLIKRMHLTCALEFLNTGDYIQIVSKTWISVSAWRTFF